MKSIFTIQFLLCSIYIFAQPVITTDIVPQTGITVKAAYNEGTIDVGPSGENQIWDFSTLSTSFDINFAILDSKEAPGSSSYPDAEFVWHLVEFENYLFYDVTDNVISQLGGVNGAVGDVTFQTINTDWEDGLQLPLTYLDTYDFFTAFDNYLFGDLISSSTRNATLTADGYGTITTPFGTYENVLRVIITREEFGSQARQTSWLHPESFLPVMVYDTDEDPETADSYYFTDLEGILSSTEPEILEEDLIVKSKNGQISIEGLKDRDVYFQLFDFMGQNIDIEQNRISNSSWTVDYPIRNTLLPSILIIQLNGETLIKKVYLY